MKTVAEVIQLSSDYLEKREVERPKRLVEELLAALLKCKRLDLYMRFDFPLAEKELDVLRIWLQRVAGHEPIEYIFGEVDFFGVHLKVDRRALIPRPETELLVDMVSKKIGGTETLLDLCTGSGCIAISLKKKFPSLSVFASDLSADALNLALENSEKNKVEIDFLRGDLLVPFQGKKADLIVCNPPYVSTSEYLTLDPSVKNFEPQMALCAGSRGGDFYQRLSGTVHHYLNPKGKLFLEIGSAQGALVQEIFASSNWAHKELIRDLSGKSRFFFLELQ